MAVVADEGQSLAALLAALTPAERAASPPVDFFQRHFALGRAAARSAVGLALGRHDRPCIEVLAGPQGEPRAWVDGESDGVGVSIAHAGRLAAACAWRCAAGFAVGVDLERVRETELEAGDYLFAPHEQALLAASGPPYGLALAQLAAWTVKEAVWKALGPRQPRHPAAVELERLDPLHFRGLDLALGRAVATVPPSAGALAEAEIRVVAGPDGNYLLTVAQIGPAGQTIAWGEQSGG